jgi:cobalt-precorrin-5B (C1)-methyltransferase
MAELQRGYTLPVFACAGAVAALRRLQQAAGEAAEAINGVHIDLVKPAEWVDIAIEQVALLSDRSALAITRSDPGDNLDLTRHTPIWSVVSWAEAGQVEQVAIAGGEGIGRIVSLDAQGDRSGKNRAAEDADAAIYAYARELLQHNLTRELTAEQKIKVTVILPAGRELALRTSNAAFGVVEGLSLLGTSGISQPLSAPAQLEAFRQSLKDKASQYKDLVFCLGENGLDLALQMGIEPERRLKTANWIGPLLVEAGLLGLRSILLFGYHGKLIKLAGGVFHTHHQVADARAEIMAACCVEAGLPLPVTQQILACPTIEAALGILRDLDQAQGCDWVRRVYGGVTRRIDARSQAYIQIHSQTHGQIHGQTHSQQSVLVGSVLFDRRRQIVFKSEQGEKLLP